jgi:predicted RNase H-like nuclease
MAAKSRQEADEITRRIDGKGVGAQAWGIYRKVQSVDEALALHPSARAAIREAHPEVCFWAWNESQPMDFSKKKPDGLRERVVLAEAWLGVGILERARGSHLKKDLADDDVVDAIAALWTAHRIADGTAKTLPASPPMDEKGLPMQIVY